MKEHRTVFGSLMGLFAPVHADGHKFVAMAGLACVFGFMLSTILGLLLFVVTVFIAFSFRDPERIVPQRAGLVVAPADGRVLQIEEMSPPEELGLGPDLRLHMSIFLSLFDVHIQRAPVSGMILDKVYMPGLFLNAELERAGDDNERRSLVIEMIDGEKIAVVQIAGTLARNISCSVDKDQRIGVGERFGLLGPGTRLDLYLPRAAVPLVAVGQSMIAGETVIVDLLANEPLRETRAI